MIVCRSVFDEVFDPNLGGIVDYKFVVRELGSTA